MFKRMKIFIFALLLILTYFFANIDAANNVVFAIIIYVLFWLFLMNDYACTFYVGKFSKSFQPKIALAFKLSFKDNLQLFKISSKYGLFIKVILVSITFLIILLTILVSNVSHAILLIITYICSAILKLYYTNYIIIGKKIYVGNKPLEVFKFFVCFVPYFASYFVLIIPGLNLILKCIIQIVLYIVGQKLIMRSYKNLIQEVN